MVSPGCTNCYAMRQAHRQSGPGKAYEGLTRQGPNGPVWTGKVRLVPEALDAPLRWKKPQRVFVNSMSDLFHEALSDDDIARVFSTMARCPQHTFQVLTKRPKRMVNLFMTWSLVNTPEHLHAFAWNRWPLPNVWLGVSAENQETADERIPLLLKTPAAVRFVSYEPALGPVDFRPWLHLQCVSSQEEHDREHDHGFFCDERSLDWVIVGGESGYGHRPFDVAWAESLIAQCRAAGVACFVKQLGSNPRWMNSACAPIEPARGKCGDPADWPESLRVREFPA